MWRFLSSLAAGKAPALSVKRGEERFSVDALASSLGSVVDLSGGGARVRSPRKPALSPGRVVPLKLHSEQCEITLKSRVAWVRRSGTGYEVGFSFVQLRPALREALRSLAEYGFIPHVEAHAARAERAKPQAPPNYYAVLGVRPDATDEQLKAAYRVAAHRYHPDASRSPERVMMFQAVAEAYRVLRDPRSRKEYDLKIVSADAA